MTGTRDANEGTRDRSRVRARAEKGLDVTPVYAARVSGANGRKNNLQQTKNPA